MTPPPSQRFDSADATASALRPAVWWQQAWVMVLAGGIVLGLSLGMRHVQGLFLLPVTMDKGWDRSTFGLAMAVQNLTWGITQPLVGMVADRYGSARVIAAGLVLYATGLYFMVQASTPAIFVWSAGICIGTALSCTAFGAVYGALSRLLEPERRGWALGLAGAIGGLAQFAMVPATQALLNSWGWGTALVTCAVLMVLMLPLAIPLRMQTPTQLQAGDGLSISAAIGEAFRHSGFWMLNLGFLACGFQLAFVATHLPSYLLDKGMHATDAVTALAIIALTNVLGTYYFGLLGTRYRRKHLLAGIYLVRTLAMALFFLLPLSQISLYLFAAVMGMAWLGTAPLTNGLVSQVFGVRYITTLFGFVFFGHQLGSFLGVWLGSHIFATTKSYDLIWIAAIGLGIAAAALHWPIDDREIQRLASPKVPA